MKANEPAYPASKSVNHYPGPTNRDKLAMEIYVANMSRLKTPIMTKEYEREAQSSLRAADIFFEQLNK